MHIKQFLAAGALTMLISSSAFAETVQLSSEQIMLNNEAVIATQAGDYKKAEQLLNAMLLINEIDFIWLQLGRTYEFQGKCIEARDAYDHIEGAPSVVEQPRERVLELMEEYRGVLAEKCTAKIVLSCRTPDMMVAFDGGSEFECHSDPIAVTPGAHAIYATTSFGFNTIRAETSAFATKNVDVEVIDYEQLAADGGLTPEEKARKSFIFKTVGWSLFGTGLAVAAGGGALWGYSWMDYADALDENKNNPGRYDYKELTSKKSDTESKLKISYGMTAAGGALLVTGIVLLVVDAVKYSTPSSYIRGEYIPQPYFNKDGAGVGMSFSF